MSALVGILSGALTQSTNAITIILMSLAAADLMTLPQAMPILAWANIGTSALVLLAAVDIHLLVYGLVGVTGFCFYLNLDRSVRWRPVVSAVLALVQLLLGLELMRRGAQEFRDFAWLREFFRETAQSQISAFLVGALLAMIAQSSATVTVLAIALASTQLITFEQAMLTTFGASIGSGFSTWLTTAKIRGSSRQLAVFQVIIKILGVGILVPLYLVERYTGTPLIAAGIKALTANPGQQIALVYLACQVAAVLAQIATGARLQPILDRLAPPLPQESLSRPRYLYDQAIESPETALTLVDREQARIFALLPLYFGINEWLEDEARSLDRPSILAVAQGLGRYVGEFLGDLGDTGAERSVLEGANDRQARNSLLLSIHESVAGLAAELSRPFDSAALAALAENLREGLGALLLTASDAVRTLDPADIALMRQLTADRDSVVEGMRRGAMEADHDLGTADHRHLYSITSLFELIVWMLRRFSGLLAPLTETVAVGQATPAAPVVAVVNH
jgi:phosphate:Na+ symporter